MCAKDSVAYGVTIYFYLCVLYSKCPKILNTLLHTFFVQILLFIQLFLKILSGKANGVDPDQTAP